MKKDLLIPLSDYIVISIIFHLTNPEMSNYFALEILEYSLVPFTASKPKEIEVLHHYEPTSTIDSEHGEPYHATISQNRTIAISTMTMFSDTPVKVTDTSVSTGSLTFTVSALVFHNTSGDPFTVTYTVDAVART
jgi:hypothetical protein